MTWAKQFIEDSILAPLTSIVNNIWNNVFGWASSLGVMLSMLSMSVSSGQLTQTDAANLLVDEIVISTVFASVLLIAAAVFATMLIMQATPAAPFMHIALYTVVPLIMAVILKTDNGLINDAMGEINSAASSTVENIIRSTLGNDLVNFETTMFGIIFGCVDSLMSFVAAAVGTIKEFASFACSIVGAIIAVASLTQINVQTTFDWVVISCFGLAFSGAGFLLRS